MSVSVFSRSFYAMIFFLLKICIIKSSISPHSAPNHKEGKRMNGMGVYLAFCITSAAASWESANTDEKYCGKMGAGTLNMHSLSSFSLLPNSICNNFLGSICISLGIMGNLDMTHKEVVLTLDINTVMFYSECLNIVTSLYPRSPTYHRCLHFPAITNITTRILNCGHRQDTFQVPRFMDVCVCGVDYSMLSV